MSPVIETRLALCREVIANGCLNIAADMTQDEWHQITLWGPRVTACLPLCKVGQLIGDSRNAGLREGLVAGSVIVLSSLDCADGHIAEIKCTGAESV
jgi:hypothetical protein